MYFFFSLLQYHLMKNLYYPPSSLTRRTSDLQDQRLDQGVERRHHHPVHDRDGGQQRQAEVGECLLLVRADPGDHGIDRKSTRLNSSHVAISYAVFCLE